MTMQTAETTRGGLRPWIWRGLVVAGAALMLVSWYMPWWSARVHEILVGQDHIVMRPWGVEVVELVAAAINRALYAMPGFFAPLMWAYLAVCLLALAASLVAQRQVSLGRFRTALPRLLVAAVGLSYLAATVGAYVVATMKAGDAGVKFIGTTSVYNPIGETSTLTGALKPGYWLAVATGPYLVALALLRNVIAGRPRMN